MNITKECDKHVLDLSRRDGSTRTREQAHEREIVRTQRQQRIYCSVMKSDMDFITDDEMRAAIQRMSNFLETNHGGQIKDRWN